MEVSAKTKYLRISPKKVRLVLDVIRGMQVEEAQGQLKFIPKRACVYILKLLNSAIANAENNFNLKKDNLYIKEITADEGPSLKRWMPRAMGRATLLKKRSSCIKIVLAEKVESKKIIKANQKIAEPIKIKEGIKDAETVVRHVEEKPQALKTEEHKPEISDVRMEGKHRHKDRLDKIQKKGKGGFLKKVFSRKAG